MFFFKHRLKMTLLRIGKHRIVKNIASLRKVNIAHPYRTTTQVPLTSGNRGGVFFYVTRVDNGIHLNIV